MRILIFTSSGGTAHDAAAYALKAWIQRWDPQGEVWVEHVLENASPVTRGGVELYNWIQRHAPWLHKLYWRLVEFEDLWKPGTLSFGRNYVIALLLRLKPDLLISTHPHINRGHFDLAQRLLPGLRCITCCTELDGGFGFSRNWLSRRCEAFWTLTPDVSEEVRRRGYRHLPAPALGPLLDPCFVEELEHPSPAPEACPLVVLGSGANGANNHIRLLESLRPLAGRIRVVALCGRRAVARQQLLAWAQAHQELEVEPLGFQDPAGMARLYRRAWLMVARPGARTATEALASGCVLVFNGFGGFMPQEWMARRYFAARGFDLAVRQPEQLLPLLEQLLGQPERYEALKARLVSHQLKGQPEAIRTLLLQGPAALSLV